MSIDIVSNRIPATPRSKYHKYMTASNVATQVANNGGGSIDTSNFVVKTGETEQTVEGSFGATGDIVAFKTSYSYFDSYLPIASAGALGCVKVGAYLTIDEDGTLNAERGGGASNWDELQGKPATLDNTNWTYAYTNAHKHAYLDALNGITPTDIAYWNSAVSYMHTHNNLAYLDTVDQNLSTTSDVNFNSVKAANDIVAFSTGITPEKFPIASTGAIGCIKVGENLTITDDGTLNAQAGGGAANWDELQGKPSGLTSENITKWNTAAGKAHEHSNKGTLDNITSTNISNWNSAANNVHWHSNMTELNDITSTNISNWNSAVSNSHWHSNKSTLDVINQSLSTSSAPTFGGGLVTGSTSGLNIQHSDGNSINGRNGTAIKNLYFNYVDANHNVLVDENDNLRATGDIIAYSKGSSSSPFKYWYPSVSSSGVLSWTNSTSTTTPSSVNIKGPKGDKGDTGKSIGKVTVSSQSTASSGKSVYNVYDVDNKLLGSFSVYNGGKGDKGDTGPKGPKGDDGPSYATSAASTVSIPSSGTTFTANSYNGLGVKLSGGNGVIGWSYNTGSMGWLYFNYVNGDTNVRVGTSGDLRYKSVSTWSDMRLKDKVESVSNVLDKLNSIDIFYYKWKHIDDNIHIGVSAQELQTIFPELVIEDKNDGDIESPNYLSVDYQSLNTVGLQGLKELHALVKDQQSQIDLLKQEIAELKNIISNK